MEAGSAITWKYPSCVLQGDISTGAFFSVALTHDKMQADTGTKMIHIGKNTRSTIISKGISTGRVDQRLPRLVKILPTAAGARNFSQCDSMLVGDESAAHTFPLIEVKKRHRRGRARSLHLAHQRGSAVLLEVARADAGRGDLAFGQRLLQRRF